MPADLVALGMGILFTFQLVPLEYYDDLETMDIIYRGRCWMDEPATTGSYSLS